MKYSPPRLPPRNVDLSNLFSVYCVCVLFQCPCLSAFIFLFFFKRWGARMSSRRRCPLSVLCGRAQPSQPQSWHGSLPGRIAGLSQLPLQLSGALKSGQRGSETLVGLYDGGPVATIAHTQTHTHTQTNMDTLLPRCRAD